MNTCLFLASILTIVLVLAHSILGEIKVLGKMNGEVLPEVKGIPKLWKVSNFTKATLRFVWHVTSVLGLCLALILLYYSNLEMLSATDIIVIKMISGSMFLSGLLTLLISRGSHLGWILFLVIAVLCFVAV